MNSLVQEFFEDSSSDEEEEEEWNDAEDMAIVTLLDIESKKRKKHGGSVDGRETIRRKRQEGHNKLMAEYFDPNPVYPPRLFRRRFRMSPDLFRRIAAAVESHDPYFKQKRSAAGILGHSPYQKITAALCILTYGVPADFLDDCLAIGESTATESLRHFVKAVVDIFGPEYLRAPNEQDTAQLLAMNKARGFPGMLGSIDCMHWRWKSCPTAWHGQFTGHARDPTIILEAIADQELWIWHAYFGMPGSCNDINVLHRSPLFARLAKGESPHMEFEANGHKYTMGYYLADGIYPAWATFVKTIGNPEGNKRTYFARQQMALRKNVERAFGVLQSRFAIVRGPARFWDQKTLWMIMTSCVIMHNMIIEDERGEEVDYIYKKMGKRVRPRRNIDRIEKFVQVYHEIQDPTSHEQLRDALVEELWKFHGERRHV